MGWGRTAVARACHGLCLSLCLVLAGVACERARSPASAAAAPQAKKTVPTPKRPKCLARGLGALRAGALPSPKCGDDGPSCGQACWAGDAVACFVHAMDLQDDPATHDKAAPVFEKACALGLAIGCTNHAADLWRSDKPADLRCAQKLFEKSCDAGETWGCGMLGRMLIDGDDAGPDEVERGRTVLEDACDELGGFSCRALALEMEEGKLGPFKKAKVRKLLARACATHDDDSCGKPRSASATFRHVSRDP
jgi:TPR repeat protein